MKVLCRFVAAELEIEEGWLESGVLVNSQLSGHTAMITIERVLSVLCSRIQFELGETEEA